MTTAIELAAGLTFDILRGAERNTQRCEEKITAGIVCYHIDT